MYKFFTTLPCHQFVIGLFFLNRASDEHVNPTVITFSLQAFQRMECGFFWNWAQNWHPHVNQTIKLGATNHACTWGGANTNITSAITMFTMYPLDSSHNVESVLELLHFYMVLTRVGVPFFAFASIIGFQLFKNSQPYFSTMCLNKTTIKTQLQTPNPRQLRLNEYILLALL
jgi:hypothetical protein